MARKQHEDEDAQQSKKTSALARYIQQQIAVLEKSLHAGHAPVVYNHPRADKQFKLRAPQLMASVGTLMSTPGESSKATSTPENATSEQQSPAKKKRKTAAASKAMPKGADLLQKFRANPTYVGIPAGQARLYHVHAALSREAKARDACEESHARYIVARNKLLHNGAGITAARRYTAAEEQISASKDALERAQQNANICMLEFRRRESLFAKALKEGKVPVKFLPQKQVKEVVEESDDDADDLLEALRSLRK